MIDQPGSTAGFFYYLMIANFLVFNSSLRLKPLIGIFVNTVKNSNV
jgi:hypothetical protein